MSTTRSPHPHHHHKNQTNVAEMGERHSVNTAPADTKDGHDERFRLIQVCAYGLWERAGKPNDDESRERFWLEAEKAITAPCSTDGESPVRILPWMVVGDAIGHPAPPPHLAGRGRIVVPDLIGMGDSDKLPVGEPDRYRFVSNLTSAIKVHGRPRYSIVRPRGEV